MEKLILLAAVTLVIGGHTALARSVDSLHGAPESSKPGPDLGYLRGVQHQQLLASQNQQAQRRATASAAITWVPCSPEAQDLGAMCGTFPVPLDRRHPKENKINIYFEVYLHTNPGPAESAILFNDGGPGLGTTILRVDALALLGQNLDAHDLLLIDDRGRGLSAPIDCQELQHGLADLPQAETDCAAQLGDAASWYGTGDVAMDTDAVRAALGYEKVDYVSASICARSYWTPRRGHRDYAHSYWMATQRRPRRARYAWDASAPRLVQWIIPILAPSSNGSFRPSAANRCKARLTMQAAT